jgi:hypothetical protein
MRNSWKSLGFPKALFLGSACVLISRTSLACSGVRDVRDTMQRYALSPVMGTPKIDDLQDAFEQTYNVRIEGTIIPVGHAETGELVRGMFLKFEKRIEILISEKCDEYWKRYVSVKEMCQLILSDPDYMTDNPADLIEMMIFEDNNHQEGEAPSHPAFRHIDAVCGL